MKMNELLKVLQVHSVRINLNINIKKTKLLRQGISGGKEGKLDNEKLIK